MISPIMCQTQLAKIRRVLEISRAASNDDAAPDIRSARYRYYICRLSVVLKASAAAATVERDARIAAETDSFLNEMRGVAGSSSVGELWGPTTLAAQS